MHYPTATPGAGGAAAATAAQEIAAAATAGTLRSPARRCAAFGTATTEGAAPVGESSAEGGAAVAARVAPGALADAHGRTGGEALSWSGWRGAAQSDAAAVVAGGAGGVLARGSAVPARDTAGAGAGAEKR